MSSAVEPFTTTIRLSIARLAQEFGMARETVSKRLALMQVKPDGERNGYPVYRLRDACPALMVAYADESGEIDPSKLKPTDRRAWFQSENERLQFEQECGRLILVDEVHCEMSFLAKTAVRFLETLPDNVERDLRCGPEVVEYLVRKVREIRADIAAHLEQDEPEPLSASAQ